MESNNPILSEQELSLFDTVVKDFNTAIKNSVLYTTEHSICEFSIKNLKETLDKWFVYNGQLMIGITQDGLFCNNVPIDSKNDWYYEVATYLHLRGLVSLTVLQGITARELKIFFSLIRQDSRAIRDAGGILQKLPEMENLQVQEIDYSELLFSAREEVESEEVEIWQKLFDVAEDLARGDIPESKMEFLQDFLKDTEKSSKTLNRIYLDAVEKLNAGPVVDQIRETIAKICAHFSKGPFVKTQEVKVDVMQILSNLTPDLVSQLFEKTQINGEEFDMAESVTKGFSDGFIADFIEALISHEESLNENLLKVFDKLAPDKAKADNVVSMVADKLLSKRILNPDTLSQLQMSIKDIFSSHPKSNFMSQMYKITVDAVTNKKIDTLVYVARLSPLINKFVQSVEESKLKKEEVWLLLNLLWLEENPDDFRKFGIKLLEVIPELVDIKDVSRIREIMEFFTDNLRPEQTQNEQMNASIKDVLGHITNEENIENIISLIPNAKSNELQEISVILEKTGAKTASLLIDAFIAERNPAYKNKYRTVIAEIKDDVVAEVMDRMDYSDPAIIHDLYHILKEYSPEKAHIVALRLVENKNPQVRWEGLDGFVPANEEEKNSIFNMLSKEKVTEIQKKAIEVLLATGDEQIIKQVFSLCSNALFQEKKLLMMVEICGQLRLKESFSYLKQLFQKKALLFKKKNDELRMSVVTSLGRLQTEESMQLIKEGTKDKREKVRKMCEIILKLDQQK